MFKNILVQALCNTGDVVLSTGAIGLLRKAYPEAKITVMVRPVSREVVEDNPYIDAVIIADYKSKKTSVKGILEFAQELKNRKFDLCISIDGKDRSAILAWVAGIPVRIGADNVFKHLNYWRRKMYTAVYSPDCDLDRSHQAEMMQSIVQQITGLNDTAPLSMATVREPHREKVRHLINQLPAHENRIALCVKGTFPLKDWPREKFVQLIDRLNVRYPNSAFYIIGAPGDHDYAEKIVIASQVPVANFCGQTSLVDLRALFMQTHLFISVCTGAVHIASTTEVPIVTIYGCTTPDRWHPLNNNYRTVHAGLTCSPCSIPADACPEHHCMNNISVADVEQAVAELVD